MEIKVQARSISECAACKHDRRTISYNCCRLSAQQRQLLIAKCHWRPTGWPIKMWIYSRFTQRARKLTFDFALQQTRVGSLTSNWFQMANCFIIWRLDCSYFCFIRSLCADGRKKDNWGEENTTNLIEFTKRYLFNAENSAKWNKYTATLLIINTNFIKNF